MEAIIEKLKLLNFEKGFCKQLGFKPFSRHYFAIPTNPGEQFFNFTSLAAWLLRTAGRQFDQPQEYDDPNATISSILYELKEMGYSIDFPPGKLKSGSGEYCIDVLNKLCDAALKGTNFGWKRPKYPQEADDVEDNVIDDDAELDLQKMDEETELVDDDLEEEESLLDLNGLKTAKEAEIAKPESIMVSNTSATEWKLEVERVMPQLKVTVRTDNKDWRQHVEQMHQHRDGIETSLTETRNLLNKMHDEITKTLDKIATREKYLNNQLEHHLTEFRTMQDRLAETKERYKQGSTGVTERTRQLAEITEELEKVKQEMEERGNSMTDGAPLVKVKQALTALKKDVQQMDIRVGVLEHCLMQAKLKEKHGYVSSKAGAASAAGSSVMAED